MAAAPESGVRVARPSGRRDARPASSPWAAGCPVNTLLGAAASHLLLLSWALREIGDRLAGKGRTVKRVEDTSGEKVGKVGESEKARKAVSRARTARCADGPAGGAVRLRWAPGSPRCEVLRPPRSCGQAGAGCPPGQRAIDVSTPSRRWSSGQPTPPRGRRAR